VPASPAWSDAAAAAQRRQGMRLGRGPIVLLGSREERARTLVDEFCSLLHAAPRVPVVRLTAERLPRYELPRALAWGPGLALYVGQGHQRGWVGYGGVEAWQLDVRDARPIGAVLSLTCRAAARPGSALSFSEDLCVRGRCAAAVGSVNLTAHDDNRSLALAIVRRVAAGAATVAEALPVGHGALPSYRIIGDPLAPLIGAHGARRGLASVFAPAPGDDLPAVDWDRMLPDAREWTG
jgi:hypothetical protein